MQNDKNVTFRINSEVLEEFKKYAGKHYQKTLKKLVEDFIKTNKKLEVIFEKEEQRRNLFRK